MKLLPIETDGVIKGYYFDCPGCGGGHYLTVRPHVANNGASWDFNGSLEAPTFQPSVLERLTFSEPSRSPKICHSFIANGKIQFLSDCTHALAGQTVEMLEIDNQ